MRLPALRADTYAFRYAIAAAIALAIFATGATRACAETVAGGGGAGLMAQPVTAPNGAFAGKLTHLSGHLDSGAGTVSITARRGQADFLPVGTAQADADGDFTFDWTPPKSGRYDFRLAPAGVSAANAGDLSGQLSVYRRQKATWYGPESYGSRTACGVKLTRRTLGVAHKTLPCGTRVEFFLRGRKIIVPVIDRGPYANGAVWDLTLTAMRRLGSSSTEVLGALPLG